MQANISKKFFILLSLLGGGIVLSGCDAPRANAPAAAATIPEVGIYPVTAQDVTITTELAGRTATYLIAEVRPQVSGIIKERPFREGTDVTAGQVLYQIDPASYQAAYDLALATVARDQASLSSAQLKVDRYKDLVTTKAVSREAYDDAVAALRQAKATVAMSQAAVESARIDLDYTRVTAPIAGRIGRSSVTQGALVTANQDQALATIQQLDPIYVDVTQSSAQLLRLQRALREGQLQRPDALAAQVGLILEDGTTYPHKGRLQFSEVSVAASTGSITLRAVFPNPDHQLLPGMFVRAVVEEGIRPQALVVPQRGVSRDAHGNATALVLGADGKVEQRQLAIDRALGNQWLVDSGLAAGDRLIIEGLQKVRAGAQARPAATVAAAEPAGNGTTP